MKKVLAFNGSPRRNGNTSVLLNSFTEGAESNNATCEIIRLEESNIKHCQGCLRCNILGYCSLRDDDWGDISKKIEESDILVFASPVYFHHVSAQMKTLIDRFRSFVKIRITETGLDHKPWKNWDKDFVLLLPMGSSDDSDALPIIDLFNYMIEILGGKCKLHVITATRLAVANQISKSEDDLMKFYLKMDLNPEFAKSDSKKNSNTLKEVKDLGIILSKT
jgi:FMN-dependent NADH-azoreductase